MKRKKFELAEKIDSQLGILTTRKREEREKRNGAWKKEREEENVLTNAYFPVLSYQLNE